MPRKNKKKNKKNKRRMAGDVFINKAQKNKNVNVGPSPQAPKYAAEFQNDKRWATDFDGKNQHWVAETNNPQTRTRKAGEAWDAGKYGEEGIGRKDIEGWRNEGKSDDEIFGEIDAARREGKTTIGRGAYADLQRRKLGNFDTDAYGEAGFGKKEIQELESRGLTPKQISGITRSYQEDGTAVGPKAMAYMNKNADYVSKSTASNNRRNLANRDYIQQQMKANNGVVYYQYGDKVSDQRRGLIDDTYKTIGDQTGIKFQATDDASLANILHSKGNKFNLIKNSDGSDVYMPKNAAGVHASNAIKNPDGSYTVQNKSNYKAGNRAGSEILMPDFQHYGDTISDTRKKFNKNNPNVSDEDWNNMYKGIMTHEIGHALGFSENQKATGEKGIDPSGKLYDKYEDYHNPAYSRMSYENNYEEAGKRGFTEFDRDQLWHMGYG